MGEIESGWRNATPANMAKIATVLDCPLVALERKRADGFQESAPIMGVESL